MNYLAMYKEEVKGTDLAVTLQVGNMFVPFYRSLSGNDFFRLVHDDPILIEEILDADPDLIILEDYQYGVTPDGVADRSAWKGLTAVKEGKVYPIIDPNLTCRQGPRIVDGLEEIARIIHPELFE